jgi:hypothetical protein
MNWDAVAIWLSDHVWIAHAINAVAPLLVVVLIFAALLRRPR